MREFVIVIPLVVILGLIIVLLSLPRTRARSQRGLLSPAEMQMENVLPRHYLYFPQIRQALSVCDEEYLDRTASPAVAKMAHRERRAVARKFLAGLHEDFSSLERLARMVAALSPVISRQQETERLILGLKFRLLYALVWLRLSTGQEPLRQIEELTSLVGRLATRMEQAMSAVTALSAPGLNSTLNA